MPSPQRSNVVMPKATNTATKRGQGHGTSSQPILSQLLHHFLSTEFAVLVKEHGAEVRTKGFPGWTSSWPCFSVIWLGPTP
ncbi:hypothetical protein DFAR_1040010 [Desulfarculales bacterium]